MLCMAGGHRTASSLTSVYLTVPGDGRFSLDRWRIRLCLRHGRQVLGGLYRRGVDFVTEDQEPDFCLGCAEPTSAKGVEVSFYEGEWAARFAGILCEACAGQPVDAFNLGLVGPEKLPPREPSTSGAFRKNGRK